MAFNTIIMAVIAIIVLVVIIYLITKGVGNLNKGTACADVQGQCVTSCDTTIIQGTQEDKPLCTPPLVCCRVI